MIGWVLVLAALAVPQAQKREPLGIFDAWGAFRDASPLRCYAIAQPMRGRGEAFASIADWPREGAQDQLHVRLSRKRHPRAHVTLSIGERRFELIAGERDAWAPDARTDAEVVSAIRSGRSMSVESVSEGGAAFADTYPLKGAATAIDAAAIACAGR